MIDCESRVSNFRIYRSKLVAYDILMPIDCAAFDMIHRDVHLLSVFFQISIHEFNI
jgi:hypothetical protein